MSKKCCGIVYKNEKFCTMCGKALSELPDVEDITETPEVLDLEEVEKIAASVLGGSASDGTSEIETKVKSVEVTTKEKTEVVEKTSQTGNESSVENSSQAVDEVPVDNSTNTDENTTVVDAVEANEEKVVQDDSSQNDNGDSGNETSDDEDDDDDDDYDDGTASAGLKFFGTLMILIMIGSIVAVGLGVYFIMLNPFYRNHDINDPVVYELMATDTDVTNIQTRPVLQEVNIEPTTVSDASQEDAVTDNATTTDATDTDASADME